MSGLVFLVCDSRSGSTYLSRQLHNACPDLAVTPEISLLYAVRALKRGARDPDTLKAALNRGRVFETLGVAEERFPGGPSVTDAQFADFIREALDAFAARTWPDRQVSEIVVKKGHHSMEAAQIKALFPEARFICLYRDPRAVYESKKRTRRPYRPGETMGWAGAALTTHRWCQYTDAMTDIERTLPAIRVRFEEFATDREGALARILGFLGLEPAKDPIDDYAINDAEIAIHGRSVGEIQVKEPDWKNGLTARELSIVETVAAKRMKALDYAPSGRETPLSWLHTGLSAGGGGLKVLLRPFSQSAALRPGGDRSSDE